MRFLVSALVTTALVGNQQANAQATGDDAAIRETIGIYFRAHATADSALMRRAFLPTAHIEGIREGRFVSWLLNDYVAFFRGTPASDEATRKRRIDTVRVVGNAASASATLEHGATVFTDFFVLLKVGGEWRIANKVYASERAP
jgi:hypothetical protein